MKTCGERYALRASREVLPGFDDFWQAYPRKLDKEGAVRAWRRLKPTPLTVHDIIAGVKLFAGTELKFVPYAGTYLNHRRWQDQPVTGNPVSSKPAPMRNPEQVETARTPAERAVMARKLRDLAESIGNKRAL